MEALANALAPGAAILLSIITLWLTQRRTQQIDERAATKDAVETLSSLNDALSRALDDLRSRMTIMEAEHLKCQQERDKLFQEVLAFKAKA